MPRGSGERRNFVAGTSRYYATMGASFHRFANPGRFLRLASRLLPWLAVVTAISFPVGLYFALVASPPDYQQGETVRIMYIHVPAAWIAMFAYAWVGLAPAAVPFLNVGSRSSRPIAPSHFSVRRQQPR